MDQLKALIREVPDFPKPGINFYDITTLLKDPAGFKGVIDSLAERYRSTPIDVVLGIEARGFIIAPAVAYALGYGFIPVRKEKKLPAERERIEYALEYGTDVLEIHKDAISPGQNVLIIDDVLATGGTAAAVARLVETLHGKVAGLGFILELDFLNGREKLHGHDVHSLIHVTECRRSAARRLRSLAKINLDLRVLHRRPDGFHELRTIFQTISLADTIEVEYQRGPDQDRAKVKLEYSRQSHSACCRCLLNATRATGRLAIRLKSESHSAAAWAVDRATRPPCCWPFPGLLKKTLPLEKLMELAAELGSDVPFF